MLLGSEFLGQNMVPVRQRQRLLQLGPERTNQHGLHLLGRRANRVRVGACDIACVASNSDGTPRDWISRRQNIYYAFV